MRYSEKLSNICAALSKVQGEIRNPIKTEVNKGVMGAPKYANLEDTLQDYVRPVLARHGMSVFQSIKSDENKVGVCTTLFHESGEFIEGDWVFCEVKIPISNTGKEILTQGQATGVNITYLRRYSLNAALGVNGDKDSDGGFEPWTSEPESKKEKKSITYESALDFVLKEGPHKDQTLAQIYKADREYINEIGKNGSDEAKEAISVINAKIKEANAKKKVNIDEV